MALVLLGLASFAQVFTLGFQSRCVNAGNYGMAFACSALIGFAQVYVWHMITAEAQGVLGATVYSMSGAVAICCAIFIHKRVYKVKN